MSMRITMLAAVLVCASLATWAYPNLNATTGILAVPTAEAIAPGASNWAADVLFFEDTTVNARVLYGLAAGFELGAAIILGEDTAFGVTGKYRSNSQIAGFNWAVGASFVTGDETGDGTQLFLAGTRPIAFGDAAGTALTGTIGINFTDIDTASALRPFVGAQLRVGEATEIASEFVFETGDFDESIFSVLLRQRLGGRYLGQIGFTNAFGFTGNADHDFFAGIAYAL